nr:MAG TPA: hypothetical protein [Bacteriophage sp.]
MIDTVSLTVWIIAADTVPLQPFARGHPLLHHTVCCIAPAHFQRRGFYLFCHFSAPFSVKVNYKNTSGLKSSRRTPYPSFSISTAISAGILFLPFTQLFTVERFFPSFAARAA